jgi:hypothetical protein
MANFGFLRNSLSNLLFSTDHSLQSITDSREICIAPDKYDIFPKTRLKFHGTCFNTVFDKLGETGLIDSCISIVNQDDRSSWFTQ